MQDPSDRPDDNGASVASSDPVARLILALGEAPAFAAGDKVRIHDRMPIGHYRVPHYVRGRVGVIEAAIEPTMLDNEAEAYGRNAGMRRHYYRVAVQMTDLWSDYTGSARDGLRIEIFETWLERI